MITDELILNRINNFWGYGNLRGKTWFIGMEEGFGGTLEDLEDRFTKTFNKEVIDIQSEMNKVEDHMKWFSPNAKIQSTWGKLISLLLYKMSGNTFDNVDIKEFQRSNFSRLTSDHCVLELMPLPSKSTNNKDWLYSQWNNEYLKSRKIYLEKYVPYRINLLRKLIEKYKPESVIFYSLTYLNYWKEIVPIVLHQENRVYSAKYKDTKYFVIPHPVAYGLSKNDWLEIFQSVTGSL